MKLLPQIIQRANKAFENYIRIEGLEFTNPNIHFVQTYIIKSFPWNSYGRTGATNQDLRNEIQIQTEQFFEGLLRGGLNPPPSAINQHIRLLNASIERAFNNFVYEEIEGYIDAAIIDSDLGEFIANNQGQ